MSRIQKLSQDVIDKIAAGEVIQKPYSVIKELTENSIDAQSKQIQVTLQNGGLKEIIIEDDGKGINVDDFPLLCERFATSKIENFGNLSSLNSFGFRGEALASVSYVSNLQIQSQRPGESFGYVANFKDSKMVSGPDIIPGQQGTKIRVMDLFYNLNPRRKSVNPIEEKKNVIKFIMSMSVHYKEIRFVVKIENKPEFSTPPVHSRQQILGIMSQIQATNFFEKELDLYNDYKCKINTVLSSLSSTKKYKEVIIFINDRYVSNESVRRAIDRGYNKCYESIHNQEGGYYVYISLHIKTTNLDPNVHPTKKEVKFLFEQEITKCLENFIYESLRDSCKIKSTREIRTGFQNNQNQSNNNNQKNNYQGNSKKVVFQNLPYKQVGNANYYQAKAQIRNDPKLQKINQFFFKKMQEKNQDLIEIEQNEAFVERYKQQQQELEDKQENNQTQNQNEQYQQLQENQHSINNKVLEHIYYEKNNNFKSDQTLEIQNDQQIQQNTKNEGQMRLEKLQELLLRNIQQDVCQETTDETELIRINSNNKDMSIQPYFDQKQMELYGPFFELEFFPLVKKQSLFSDISLSNFITPILKQDDIYKIFERC